MKLSSQFLIKALPNAQFYTNGRLLTVNDVGWNVFDSVEHVPVSIDSRTVQPGDFFIALRGPNFDGHTFVIDAIKKGACGALISKHAAKGIFSDLGSSKALFIVVDNTLDAFIDLAKAWRATLTCPVVGITGSVGKTTTKEMLRSIVQRAGIESYVSFKNYNNVFGLCYNILCIPNTVAAVFLEVGINERGEMIQLADILRPTIGIITCIAHAHLEGLGDSLHVVSAEKRQLFAFFSPQDVGIVCGDQPLLSDVYYAHPTARFGLKTKNQVQARRVRFEVASDGSLWTNFVLKWYGEKIAVRLPGNHAGFVNNALAASAVAYFLKIPLNVIVAALQTYKGMESRFELKSLKNGRGVLLNDCYNANPESMKMAITAFSQLKAMGKKIAVLGDMLELGNKEDYWHRQIGRIIGKVAGIDSLILVGELARKIGSTAPDSVAIFCVKDWQEASQKLEAELAHPDSMVLVKASHGMQLEKMVKALAE